MKKRIKSIIAFILLFGVIICGSSACFTGTEPAPADMSHIGSYLDIPGVTAEEIAAIEDLKSNRRNFTFGNMILTESFVLPDGTHSGFATMLCELLTDLFDIPFVQKFHSWDMLKDGIDSMEIDFTGELTPTPERQRKYFMTHAIAERSLAIFTYAGSAEIETAEGANGLRIGFLEGATNIQSLVEAYPDLQFETVWVRNEYDVAWRLREGEIDAYITEAVDAASFENFPNISYKEVFPLVFNSVSLATANPELEPFISVF
ncbi:MAG: transporter substrate-binding domain-containing protein, partial [Synergistaceae bacterium]|nr:transporter substrate-binding domain-containing protein [Synergistaceae bacterium]